MSELDGLRYVVQYRKKADGIKWLPMAAFDVVGAAESYYEKQRGEDDWPWEYRLIEINPPSDLDISTVHQTDTEQTMTVEEQAKYLAQLLNDL